MKKNACESTEKNNALFGLRIIKKYTQCNGRKKYLGENLKVSNVVDKNNAF